MRRIINVLAFLFVLAAMFAPGDAALAQARVGAEKQTYAPYEPVTVQWSGLPARQNGFVGIGQVGGKGFNFATEQNHSLSNYHGDVSSGRHTFRGLGPGTYEVRLILPPPNDDAVVLARATITVQADGQAAGPGAPSLKSDKQVYEQMEEIKVSWSNITLVNGFVGIGKRGGGAFSFADREPSTSLPSNWQGRPANGSFTFPGRLAGEYEIRIVTDYYGSQVLLRYPITVKE